VYCSNADESDQPAKLEDELDGDEYKILHAAALEAAANMEKGSGSAR